MKSCPRALFYSLVSQQKISYAVAMPEDHFKGKDAIEHVAERQAQGIIDSVEIHGHEIPGHLIAATDAARDSIILLLSLWLFLRQFEVSTHAVFIYLAIIGGSWMLWKAGRSAWIGWSRLERLHRVLEQEKWEIEHNRSQEKEELKALYHAKGFSGKLLDDVVDVLMADGDRLLRVMVEEELGLSLQSTEHPLKQAFGAATGCLSSTLIILASVLLWPSYGPFLAGAVAVGFAATVAAHQSQNRITNAIVWNVGLAALTIGSALCLLEFFFPKG